MYDWIAEVFVEKVLKGKHSVSPRDTDVKVLHTSMFRQAILQKRLKPLSYIVVLRITCLGKRIDRAK